jgi:hypothetical protein
MTVIDFVLQKRNDLQPAWPSANIKPSAAATAASKDKPHGLSKASSMPEEAKPVVRSEPEDVKSVI